MSGYKARPGITFGRIGVGTKLRLAGGVESRFLQAAIDPESLSLSHILTTEPDASFDAFSTISGSSPVFRHGFLKAVHLAGQEVLGQFGQSDQPIIGLPVYARGSSHSLGRAAGMLVDSTSGRVYGLLLADETGNLNRRAIDWQSLTGVSNKALYVQPHPTYINALGNQYADDMVEAADLPQTVSMIAPEHQAQTFDVMRPVLAAAKEALGDQRFTLPINFDTVKGLDDLKRQLTGEVDDLTVDHRGALQGETTDPDDPPHIPASDTGGATRYFNAWFRGHADPDQPLALFRQYTLRLEVHPLLREGNAVKGDVRFSEPDQTGEEFVEIVIGIVADGFDIVGDTTARMKLPTDKRAPSPIVEFTVKPVMNRQDIHLDVLFYQRNNLFHAARITAHALPTGHPLGNDSAYVKTATLAAGAAAGGRDVNIFVTHEFEGYRVVVFHDDGKSSAGIDWCMIHVSPEWVSGQLAGVRDALREAVRTGSTAADGSDGVYFLPADGDEAPATAAQRLINMRKPDDALYQQTLQALARAGRRLYSVLFDEAVKGSRSDRDRARRVGHTLRQLSRARPLRIQIHSQDFIVPWNILYDGDYPSDTIDDDAFWGFRHTIEEIPSSPGERSEPQTIDSAPPAAPPGVTIGMNLMRDASHAKHVIPQVNAVRALAMVHELALRQNDPDILAVLAGNAPPMAIEYFYCHAKTGGDYEHNYDTSYLSLSEGQTGLTLDDIRLATVSPDALAATRPLIVLNACESAEFDGRFYDGFVPWFLAQGARAVLGTDCEVPALFAAHFGTSLLTALAQGAPVGETLLELRKTFRTTYRNPLGLIYRVFGNIDARSSPLMASSPPAAPTH